MIPETEWRPSCGAHDEFADWSARQLAVTLVPSTASVSRTAPLDFTLDFCHLCLVKVCYIKYPSVSFSSAHHARMQRKALQSPRRPVASTLMPVSAGGPWLTIFL